MLNLNTVDLESTVKELAFALANYMDGVKDHEVQTNTGLENADCVRIVKARKLSEEVLGW